jgi:hypothetical protein
VIVGRRRQRSRSDDVVIVSVGGRSPRFPVVLRRMVWHPTEVDIVTDDLPHTAVRLVEPYSTTTLGIFYPPAVQAAEPFGLRGSG